MGLPLMAGNSLNQDSKYLNDFERKEDLAKNHYFDNETVEHLMYQYVAGACIDVSLRDAIMVHASELIRQIIKAHNLAQICPGKDETCYGDLFQTAWAQVESTLYKYDARPHCKKSYNKQRPNDSIIIDQFIQQEDLVKKIKKCPICYGEITEDHIYYKGTSKIFNLWCVNPNTKLITNEGVLPINNVMQCNKLIYGLNGLVKTNASIRKPKQKTIITTTQYNYYLESSPEHGLYKLTDIGPKWEHVKNLKVGDVVGLQLSQQMFVDNDDLSDIKLAYNAWDVPNKITSNLAYFFGLYLAEGSYCNNMVSIYNIDEDVKNFLYNNDFGLKFKHYAKNCSNYSCSKSFLEFLDKIGFDQCHLSTTKFIPNRLLQMSKDNIYALLSGLFDGDGHSSSYNGEIGLTSTSIQLIEQVRMLLLNIGILSKLYLDPRKVREFHKKNGNIYISKLSGAYMIRLSAIDSLKFYDRIGFRIKRKQNNMSQVTTNSMELAFFVLDKFVKLHKKYGSVGHYEKLRKLIKPGYVGTISIAKKSLEYWAKHSNDPDYQFINNRLSEHFRSKNRIIWLPILKFTESESELCDIEVDSNDHSYIANGFVSHNSQVSRTCALAYIKKENRDRKNSTVFQTHIRNKQITKNEILDKFFKEVVSMYQYNDQYLHIIESIKQLYIKDEKPYDGFIGKIVEKSKMPRSLVIEFLTVLRLRANEFTNSPINEEQELKYKRDEEDSQYDAEMENR